MSNFLRAYAFFSSSPKTKYQCTMDDTTLKIIQTATHGLMGISVGSHLQSGSRLSALMDLVLTYFDQKPFTFYICDSLRGHNLSVQKNIALPEARALAIKNADLWLDANDLHLRRRQPHHCIQRWNDVLAGPKYPDALLGIENLYRSDDLFYKNIQVSVKEHLQRSGLQLSDDLSKASVRYLLEEFAGIASLISESKATDPVDLYPGHLSLALDGLIGKQNLPESLKSLSIRQAAVIGFKPWEASPRSPLHFS